MALTRITGTVIKDGGIHHSDLPDSGVTANSYGSGTAIPVLTVNSKGIVTAVSETSVAGVSSLSWDSGTEVLTLNTADGGSYTADLSGMASQSYVDTAINNLIASAPGTLDTLDELAAALGDDANFATTITNSLAGKVDKINITGTTVGDASNVPVITFNSQGQITSATTTAVAGVSSVTYNNQTGVLTINTSDGGSHTADINVGYDDDPTFETVTIKDTNGIRGIGRNNNAYNLNLLGGADQTDGAWIEINGGQRGGAGNALNGALTFYTGSDHSASQNAVVGDYYFKTQWLGNSKTLMSIDSSTGYVGINATPSATLTVGGNISVTGTVKGRDIAADGTKLDGIEVGATADQTASEILTLLKTVDGSGSGLDADLLDGISSASFLRSDIDDTVTGQITFPTSIGSRPVFGEGILARPDLDDTAGTHDIWGISERYYPSNSTAADAWGIQWSGTPNEINFIGEGQKKLSIDLDTTGNIYMNTSGGNVGIGTTSPETKLHVNNGMIISGVQDTANSAYYGMMGIRALGSGLGGYGIHFEPGFENPIIWGYDNGDNGGAIRFATMTSGSDRTLGNGLTDRMVIETGTGSVLIGSDASDSAYQGNKLVVGANFSGGSNTVAQIGTKNRGIYFTTDNPLITSGIYYASGWVATNSWASFVDMEGGRFTFRTKQSGLTAGNSYSTETLNLSLVLDDNRVEIGAPRFKMPAGTSDPATASSTSGDMYYNTAEKTLKIYDSNDGTWNAVYEPPVGSADNPVNASNIIGAGLTAGETYNVDDGTGNIIAMEYSGDNFKGTGRGYFLAWQGGHQRTQVSSILGNGFLFSQILIEAIGGPNTYHTMGFASSRPFDVSSSTTTANSGSKSGYRLFLGGAGAHGIYNTSQSPCNWGSSAGAFGSGYDGSCGSYPNDLRMGNGVSGDPHYTSYGGDWYFWISF